VCVVALRSKTNCKQKQVYQLIPNKETCYSNINLHAGAGAGARKNYKHSLGFFTIIWNYMQSLSSKQDFTQNVED
jgi:hypothetical protein